MAIKSTDFFLVSRDGQSYRLAASNLTTKLEFTQLQQLVNQVENTANNALPLSGGTLSGPLVLDGNASGDEAAPWSQIQTAIQNAAPKPSNLPIASSSTLGAIKVGANLEINPSTGVLSGKPTGVQSITGTKPIRIDDTDPSSPIIDITPATITAAGSMSASDKTKLNGIQAGANVNVQADWTETDSASDAYIKHKPEPYELPIATSNVLGGIMVGSGLKIDAGGTLEAFIQGALEFKGSIKPTDPAPSNPRQGDVYVISEAGTMASSWTGIAGDPVVLHELIAYDGNEWDLMGAAANTGVTEVQGISPVVATGTHTVQISIKEATDSSLGVTEYATASQTSDGALDNRAVTPASLSPVLATKASVSALDAVKTTAENAKTAAAAAQSTADQAETDAQTGISDAKKAQTTADNALSVANAALPLSGGTLTGPLSVPANASGTQVAQWSQIQTAIQNATPNPKNLPIATTSALGAVIVGDNLEITAEGVLSGKPTGVQTVTGAAPIAVDSTDPSAPNVSINAATPSTAGSMSASDKTKLDTVQTGAQVNVQADWAVTNSQSDAYIKNKPAPYQLPIASSSVLGGIKVGTGLQITGDGTLDVQVEGALIFRGAKKPSDTAPSNPSSGDVYVMSAAGTMSSSWNGVAGQAAVLHEMVAYDGIDGEWEFLGAAANTGVTTINAAAPLTSTGTHTVNLGITNATLSSVGVVQLLDSVSSSSTAFAATPKSVSTAYSLAAAALPKSGGTLSGPLTATSITASGAISATNFDISKLPILP